MKEKKEGKKGFFGRLIEKLDKKMEEKSKASSCCSENKGSQDRPCCGK